MENILIDNVLKFVMRARHVQCRKIIPIKVVDLLLHGLATINAVGPLLHGLATCPTVLLDSCGVRSDLRWFRRSQSRYSSARTYIHKQTDSHAH